MPESICATTPMTTASPIGGTPTGPLKPAGSSALAVVDSAPVLPVPAKKLRPWRVKAPKDSKVYKAAVAIVALKAQGMKTPEIAEQLALSKETVKTYLKRAVARGWINFHSFDDPEDQIESVLKHKVVGNLNALLDERDDAGAVTNRSMEVSLEVAKGTGLLKQHQVVKTEGQTNLGVALKVQVEMPPQAVAPIIRAGSIGGTPSFDAEIIEEDKERV